MLVVVMLEVGINNLEVRTSQSTLLFVVKSRAFYPDHTTKRMDNSFKYRSEYSFLFTNID